MDRIHVENAGLAKPLGDTVVVGRAFVFLSAAAFRQPALAWVDRLRRSPGQSEILTLFGGTPVTLPGASISPVALSPLRLASVTCDKSLYREGHDSIHLLVLDPGAGHGDVQVVVSSQGTAVRQLPVRLDAQGAALAVVRDLPCGDYDVRLADQTEASGSFTVAEYRLVPLVAGLEDRRLEGDKLSVTLSLSVFGQPFEGDVKLELTEAGYRFDEQFAVAVAGRVQATFQLSGDGPHAINVQLVSDPARTASVPIVGSRAAERSSTTFSRLGLQVDGALLPGPDAVEVRGLYLTEGGTSNSPLRLERVDTRKARLSAVADIETFVVVAIDPSFVRAPLTTLPHPGATDRLYQQGEKLFAEGRFPEARASFLEGRPWQTAPHPNWAYFIACCLAREARASEAVAWLRLALRDGFHDLAYMHGDPDLASLRGLEPFEALAGAGQREVHRGPLSAGQRIEFDVPGPTTLLLIGAWIEGKPWEGWAATVAPSTLTPVLHVPDKIAPGDDVSIEIEAKDGASVYLLVKDARLLSADTPQSRLASRIKAYVEGAGQALQWGPPTETFANLPEQLNVWAAPTGGAPPMLGSAARSGGLVRRGGPMPPPALSVTRLSAAPYPVEAPGPYAFDAVAEVDEEIVFAAAPQATAAVPPPSPARAAAEEPEVVFAGLLTAVGGRAKARITLGPQFADYLVTAFVVADGDWAAVECRRTAARSPYVELLLPPFLADGDVAVGRVLSDAKVQVFHDGEEITVSDTGCFLVQPGTYVARATSASGQDERQRTVERPGKLRRLARSVRLLNPGESLSRHADPTIQGLTLLAGIDKPYRNLLDATSDYGHLCCEQTAAKIFACVFQYVLADSPSDRGQIEAAILAGLQRERSMYLPERGFRMYPESGDQPNDHYGKLAAQYLRYLALLEDDKHLTPALRTAVQDGVEMSAGAMRGYRMHWPDARPNTCQGAYLTVRFNSDKSQHAAALEVVRQQIPAGGRVHHRVEMAYAAAVMLRLGVERDKALALANMVFEQMGPDGGYYSTLDSVAAIAMTSELKAAGILGPGKVVVDGQTLATTDVTSGGAGEVKAVEGVVSVEVIRVVEEDWGRFQADVPLTVSLERQGRAARRCTVGDALDLVVKLETGYKAGDLLWVCLPDALTRVVGGGQVKRFSVDFKGRNEVRVPLAATEATIDSGGESGPQHYAVCVRNMFEEERGGNPGPLDVIVSGPATVARKLVGKI